LAALVLLAAAPARAVPDVPERQVQIDDDGRFVSLSAAFPDLLDDDLKHKLDSGFATNVVVRAFLFREGAAAPDALALRTFRVAYDLWDEVYLVEERDDAGVRRYREKSRDAAARRMTTLQHLPIGDCARMPVGQRYVAALLIEVNPVSPELLAQVRRWLTRPPEGHRFAGAGESFFGSFVSIFVNPHVGDAEKVLRFRSSAFWRTKPPPRGGAK
jgi:hypothetical protein